MDRLVSRTRQACWRSRKPLVLAGDYNVIPASRATSTVPGVLGGRRAVPAASRAQGFGEILIALGLTEAVPGLRRPTPEVSTASGTIRLATWQKNNGIRIDHLLLSPQAADRLVSCTIEKRLRSWEKPSDHVPVVVELTASKAADGPAGVHSQVESGASPAALQAALVSAMKSSKRFSAMACASPPSVPDNRRYRQISSIMPRISPAFTRWCR
jgi:hypothetical protein